MDIQRGTTTPGTNDGSFAPQHKREADPAILAGGTGFDADDWTTATWTPTAEDPSIVELDGPGWIYAYVAHTGRETYQAADYDLPLERDRYEAVIHDADTGHQIAAGVADSLNDAKRFCQHAWNAISDAARIVNHVTPGHPSNPGLSQWTRR